MNLRRRPRMEPEVNVTSFSDLAFLLIIFFILTTELAKPAGRKLSIPSATTDASQKDVKQVTVTLSPTGILYGEKAQKVTFEELRKALEEEKFPQKAEKDRLVVVETAETVAYDEYYRVVMVIQKAGAGVALIDREEEGAKK